MQAEATGGVRFAPSPTGRFHVGNLRTAWIAKTWAEFLNLPWVVRFEDIDRPRVISGAVEQQVSDLLQLGLSPDFRIIQSGFSNRHWELFRRGVELGKLYACDCSRKEVQHTLSQLASAPHEHASAVYSGHCRNLQVNRELSPNESLAWRFKSDDASGAQDFIIARTANRLDENHFPLREGFTPAYHWACAIDDLDGRYELLVRAVDLLPVAPLQQQIQQWMVQVGEGHGPLPSIFHTSLVVQDDGHRLEKRTAGVTLDELIKNGYAESELLRIFNSSFDRGAMEHFALEMRTKAQPLPLMSSELKARLTLAELGLKTN